MQCGDLLSEESKDILLDIRLPSLLGVLGVDQFEFKIRILKVSYLRRWQHEPQGVKCM